jgi:hypothetical protein
VTYWFKHEICCIGDHLKLHPKRYHMYRQFCLVKGPTHTHLTHFPLGTFSSLPK